MNIVFYCQHVLGLGHLMRSLAIVRALAPHRVVFVAGGPEAPVALPPNAVLERLPAMAMDEEFKAVHCEGDPQEVKARRAAMLAGILERERPDVFLVELYPFGRRAFEFELVPALTAIREGAYGRPAVLCSLRDILVEKSDPDKYQSRVLARLNSLFDALLVHSDPALFPLEETFPRLGEVAIPVHYTGFVTETPSPGARETVRRELGVGPDERLVVASAGGGKVGSELLFAAVRAYPFRIADVPVRLRILTGPFLDEDAFWRLGAEAAAHEAVRVDRFAGDFLDLLAAADLSLSLAGYNTVMNVLAASVPALAWPFAQNREQRTRAERLERLGALTVLDDADLEPGRLAALAGGVLAGGKRPAPGAFRLDGAARTAAIVAGGRWL